MAQKANVVELPLPDGSASKPKRSFIQRWKHEAIFKRGFVPVPTLFLQHYADLKPEITPSEAMFILHLMEFKWDADHPYPGYKTLPRRMGRSEKAVQGHAQNLEIKGYLRRQLRRAETNKFDLTPLFDVLLAKAQELEMADKKNKKV
jgi:Helix-turn-helix domain